MRTKQFKAESKKLMDMMINSIYTHKEIFLRELISNASDAEDKLYFRSLTDQNVGLAREDFKITISADKNAGTLTIADNGVGMTEEELDKNLGTIAKSGSLEFKKANDKNEEIDVIGQFGVGFYSAFMVADKVTVESRAYGADTANRWTSSGADGYTIEPCEKADVGSVVTLHLKADTEDDKYSEFLDAYRISALVKKYSDYIRYPIVMDMETTKLKEGIDTSAEDYKPSDDDYETVIEPRTLNSMIPLWKKNKSEITKEQYNAFYKDNFFDYEDPLVCVHTKTEGSATFSALLYIPAHAPYDYYTKNFEKGLKLYSKGVLISEKCGDLLPDYFSFVKGLVDSEDLSLNISREMLQHDRQLQLIARTIEKKIKSELTKLLENDREGYEKFYKAFGTQLKFGIYNDYGAHKDVLQDLILFPSSNEGKLVSLKEYADRMPESQKAIYYACGETKEKIDMLPQAEAVKDKGYELLYFTDQVDEFAIKMLMSYNEKPFANVCADDLDLATEEEKDALKKENEAAKDIFTTMKEALGDAVSEVRFTGKLKNHPVCLTSEGGISLEMEKVLGQMPGAGDVKARVVMEINSNHAIADKLRADANDAQALEKYAKLLYAEARLIEGMSVENPVEIAALINELLTK
ncbi:MAG: molecular chaperone HtpG [Clostridia bacterium]|nr:molecular chaperone HtpG [Clostridia bacterium]